MRIMSELPGLGGDKPVHRIGGSDLCDLFGMARKGPSVFEETFRHTWVSIDQRRFSGEIYLSVEIFTPLPKHVVDTLIEYVPSEEFFRGDLQIHARLTASTIAALARAADRVTP